MLVSILDRIFAGYDERGGSVVLQNVTDKLSRLLDEWYCLTVGTARVH